MRNDWPPHHRYHTHIAHHFYFQPIVVRLHNFLEPLRLRTPTTTYTLAALCWTTLNRTRWVFRICSIPLTLCLSKWQYIYCLADQRGGQQSMLVCATKNLCYYWGNDDLSKAHAPPCLSTQFADHHRHVWTNQRQYSTFHTIIRNSTTFNVSGGHESTNRVSRIGVQKDKNDALLVYRLYIFI